MPSPFPGMDPYLEGSLWTTFHFAFGAEIVTTHLLEIDLLRQGRRLPMRDPLPPAEYFILLSHAEHRPITDGWRLSLHDQLPAVPIPLLPGDAEVSLDLQQTFTATYDLLEYDLAIDYTRSPEPTLDGAASAIADNLLHAAGLRPA